MRPPCTIVVISVNTPFLLLLVMSQVGCCQIFHIRNNRLINDPFWKLYCWPLIWIPIITISIAFTISFDMTLFATLVKICNWLGRQISHRILVFPTMVDFDISFICSLDNWLFNFPNGKFGERWSSWDFSLISVGSYGYEVKSLRYSSIDYWKRKS